MLMILPLAPFLIPGFFLEDHFFLLQSELSLYGTDAAKRYPVESQCFLGLYVLLAESSLNESNYSFLVCSLIVILFGVVLEDTHTQ